MADRAQVVAEAQTWDGVPYRLGGWSRRGVDCRGLWYQVLLACGLADANGGKRANVRAIKASAVARGFWHPLESGYAPQPGDGVIYASTVGGGKGPENIQHFAIVTGAGSAFSALSPRQGTHAHPLRLLPKVLKILGFVELNLAGGGAPAPVPFLATHTYRRAGRVALRESPQVQAPAVAWAESGSLIQAADGRSGGLYRVRTAAGDGIRSRLWLEVIAQDGHPVEPPLWTAELAWVPLPSLPKTEAPPAPPSPPSSPAQP